MFTTVNNQIYMANLLRSSKRVMLHEVMKSNELTDVTLICNDNSKLIKLFEGKG